MYLVCSHAQAWIRMFYTSFVTGLTCTSNVYMYTSQWFVMKRTMFITLIARSYSVGSNRTRKRHSKTKSVCCCIRHFVMPHDERKQLWAGKMIVCVQPIREKRMQHNKEYKLAVTWYTLTFVAAFTFLKWKKGARLCLDCGKHSLLHCRWSQG